MKYGIWFALLMLLWSCQGDSSASTAETKKTPKTDQIKTFADGHIVYADGTRLAFPATKQSDGRYLFLVRHAEKAASEDGDPPLTGIGQQRADRLRTILKDANIGQVYSSDYQRTRSTGMPLAEQINQDLNLYNPGNLPGFSKKLLADSKGGNALIVGHSNTTPQLVNLLVGKDQYNSIDESDYGNLFVVYLPGSGSATVERLSY